MTTTDTTTTTPVPPSLYPGWSDAGSGVQHAVPADQAPSHHGLRLTALCGITVRTSKDALDSVTARLVSCQRCRAKLGAYELPEGEDPAVKLRAAEAARKAKEEQARGAALDKLETYARSQGLAPHAAFDAAAHLASTNRLIGTHAACDLVRKMIDLGWRPALGQYAPSRVDPRACLRCGTDLTDVMGCYVFTREGTSIASVPGLLCVEHGANGQNTMSPAEYARLTTKGGPR